MACHGKSVFISMARDAARGGSGVHGRHRSGEVVVSLAAERIHAPMTIMQ
jgi:hypothetical protein